MTPRGGVHAPSGPPEDLEGLLAFLGRALARGAHDPRSPLRTLALATQGAEGPRLRTVVLRAADLGGATLQVHTDRRAAKVREVRHNEAVAVLFWDPRHRQQLRAEGRAAIAADAAAHDRAWRALSPEGRAIYSGGAAPGTRRADAGTCVGQAACRADDGRARQHFAVLEVALDRLDWLWLGRQASRRATFSRLAGAWRGHWVEP